jgi:hypothetical protein
MSNYFSYLPNIRVGIPEENNSLKNYVEIKNLFRRVRFAAESVRKITYFEKYNIPGDDKPYNVSHNIYNTPRYEWIILLLNDITNVYTQWPLSQREFEYMIREKYGTQGELQTHHWETNEIKDVKGNIIIPKGMVVSENFTKTLPNGNILSGGELVSRITHYEYEYRINESKREIFLPYPDAMFAITNELTRLLQYYSSVDTQNLDNNTKNSGDDDFYNFKYFNLSITE